MYANMEARRIQTRHGYITIIQKKKKNVALKESQP